MLRRYQRVIVLVRHAEAKSTEEDPVRPLSVFGLQQAERMASWLVDLRLQVAEIRHSGKARARETAEVLGSRLGLSPGLVRGVPGVAPNDDVEPVARELEADRRALMLVGHLPFLARLASRLLTGDPACLNLSLANAGVAVLVRASGGWQLVALLSHEMR
jgi:phosphohistidine phosphatase